MGEETAQVVKIKQEKLSPEREVAKDPQDEIDKILDSRPFSENDEKKNLEPAKTSDELLEELFGVIGANVNAEDIFNGSDKKKKKKKRKHSDDDEGERSSKKVKKVKKEKKVKDEPDSEEELIKKIKKEKKDKEREKEKPPEKRKLSIVIKDFKLAPAVTTKSSQSSSSRDKERKEEESKKKSSRDRSAEKKKKSRDKDRDRSKEKERSKDKKSRDKKSSSDISLSDEDSYRTFYEYHMSSHWEFGQPVREWDRGKQRVDRDRDRDRDRERDRRRDDRHFESRHHHYRHRTRSRSRSQSRRSPIDKKRLLEIARKNAISMLKSGVLPRISTNTKEKLMAKIRHGGKTIEELTNYCKKLSRAEDLGELSDLSDSEGESLFRPFHHPFEVKDRGPIVMNIKNSVPIAPKPASELKAIMAQFPVSSGKQHQMVENAWIPVKSTNPSTSTTSTTTTTTASSATTKPTTSLTKQIQEQLPELALPKPKAPPPPVEINPVLQKPYNWKNDDHYCKDIIPALAPPPAPPCDVSEIISQRLNAMRKLQENPTDNNASKVLFETQQNMSAWAASKFTPGQFLGSTDVRVLSQRELAAGQQAWAKKTQLIDTRPVTSGMGMHLLQKMGWTPGEGLGKEKNGNLEPLLLELKFDKRGLEASEEILRQQKGNPNKMKKGPGPRGGNKPEPISMESLQQKHPVSLLGELASKRRWGAPNYILVSEKGPAHAKNFVFKIKLNGIEYTCPNPANNKKEAKAVAARFCLKELGILP